MTSTNLSTSSTPFDDTMFSTDKPSRSPSAAPRTPRASTARSTAIAIETLDGKGTIRRALLEDCIFAPSALTPENARILGDFERGLDRNLRVVAVSAIRAFRNTGAASARSEAAADEVRHCTASHHAAFPIVALVTRRTTPAPCELLSFDPSTKTAQVRYGSAAGAGSAARSPSVQVDVRVVLCCACDRSAHGDFLMPFSHFDQQTSGAAAASGSSVASPTRVLARQLGNSLKQLERFLAAPPPQFEGDGAAPLLPLREELRKALKALEDVQRSKRSHHAISSQSLRPISTPTPALQQQMQQQQTPSDDAAGDGDDGNDGEDVFTDSSSSLVSSAAASPVLDAEATGRAKRPRYEQQHEQQPESAPMQPQYLSAAPLPAALFADAAPAAAPEQAAPSLFDSQEGILFPEAKRRRQSSPGEGEMPAVAELLEDISAPSSCQLSVASETPYPMQDGLPGTPPSWTLDEQTGAFDDGTAYPLMDPQQAIFG